MHKRSFTLMEMLLVIIILGALSGLALPRFMKFMEIQRAEAAKQQMRLVVAAIDYWNQNRISFPAECAFPNGCDSDFINTNFELDIHDPNFQYKLLITSDGVAWAVAAGPNTGGYSLFIWHTDPDLIVCTGDCARINM